MSTYWEAFQTKKKMPDSAYVQILEYFSLTMTFCGGNKEQKTPVSVEQKKTLCLSVGALVNPRSSSNPTMVCGTFDPG